MARVVSFRLGLDQFGVEAAVVERVLRYTPPRVLPRLPDWVDGVIDYDHPIGITGDEPLPRQYIAFAVGYMKGLLDSLPA